MTDCGIIIDATYHNTLIDDRKANNQDSGAIFEKFLEDKQPLVKELYATWGGHAERKRLERGETETETRTRNLVARKAAGVK